MTQGFTSQFILPPDGLLFEDCLVSDPTVADTLSSWRQTQEAPVMTPRVSGPMDLMSTASFEQASFNHDQQGHREAISQLSTLCVFVAQCWIGNREILLYDATGRIFRVELEDMWTVDYDHSQTGNVHYDIPLVLGPLNSLVW